MIADALQRLRELPRYYLPTALVGPWIRAADLDAVLATVREVPQEPILVYCRECGAEFYPAHNHAAEGKDAK